MWVVAVVVTALLVISVLYLGLAGDPEAEKTTLTVPGQGVDFFWVEVGRREGFFEAENLEVEVISTLMGQAAVQAVISGDVDFTLSVTSSLIAFLQGADLRVVGISEVNQGWGIAVRPEIEEFSDLRGKQVLSFSAGAGPNEFFLEILRSNGLDPSTDLEVIAQGGAQTRYTALISGNADGAMLGTPYNVLAEREGMRQLVWAPDVLPPEVQYGLITRPDVIEEKRDVVLGMLRAMVKSLEWITTENEEATALVMEIFNVNEEVARETLDLMTPIWEYEPDIEALESSMQRQAEALEVQDVPSLHEWFDDSVYRELEGSGA